jgi:glucose-1-phosphate thymidylyltransferase
MHEASEAVQTVTNFFLFHSGYLEIAQAILASPTPQNHLVDLHERYLARKQLFNVCLDQRATWLSPRTADEFLESALLLRTLIGQNGLRAGYVEAAAYRAGYLEDAAFYALAKRAGNSPYGDYLREIAAPNQFAA